MGDPSFESPLLLFQSLSIILLSTTPPVLCCVNEYVAIDCGGNKLVNSLRVVLAARLNTSHRRQAGVRINRYALERSVKRLERSDGLDTTLYKNIYLPSMYPDYNIIIDWNVHRMYHILNIFLFFVPERQCGPSCKVLVVI